MPTPIYAIALAGDSSIARSVDNGATWDEQTVASNATQAPVNWKAIAWSGSVFCAIGAGPYASPANDWCFTSSDGLVWSQGVMPSKQLWTGICWTGSMFIATSGDGYTASSVSATAIPSVSSLIRVPPCRARS